MAFSAHSHHARETLELVLCRVVGEQVGRVLKSWHFLDIQLTSIHFLLCPQLLYRQVLEFSGAVSPTDSHRGCGISENSQLDTRAATVPDEVPQP